MNTRTQICDSCFTGWNLINGVCKKNQPKQVNPIQGCLFEDENGDCVIKSDPRQRQQSQQSQQSQQIQQRQHRQQRPLSKVPARNAG
jgi:hypothetical protein